MTGLERLAPGTVEAALDDHPPNPTVAGVLLAAGQSTRFGEANKLLARVDGEPLVRRTGRTLDAARVSSVSVVLGHDGSAVRDALSVLDVQFVENDEYEQGLSTSVRAGVDVAIEMAADAAVFLPGDMPFVDVSTVDVLIDAHRAGLSDAVAAAHHGQRGNPVLFDSRHFDALRSVAGDTGGRRVLLDSERGALVEVDDPGVTRDIDTRTDLERTESGE